MGNRQFAVAEPDKVWAVDVTFLRTGEGGLFLAMVIDLFSAQALGWSLREGMPREIVIDALRTAWPKRHPGKQAGLIFHSDRSSQCASKDFRDMLTQYSFTASMSRRGNCWHNACKRDNARVVAGGAVAPPTLRVAFRREFDFNAPATRPTLHLNAAAGPTG